MTYPEYAKRLALATAPGTFIAVLMTAVMARVLCAMRFQARHGTRGQYLVLIQAVIGVSIALGIWNIVSMGVCISDSLKDPRTRAREWLFTRNGGTKACVRAGVWGLICLGYAIMIKGPRVPGDGLMLGMCIVATITAIIGMRNSMDYSAKKVNLVEHPLTSVAKLTLPTIHIWLGMTALASVIGYFYYKE